MKLIISSVLLCGISQASRLLQAADLVACTMDAKLCPDGKTYVGRQAPKCEFAPCPITQTPIQQLCGGNGLLECDEGYTCVANPNCPKLMTDCPGICVQIPIPVKPICGGFNHCKNYFDGCNKCKCGANGVSLCTQSWCDEETREKPFCAECNDGYVLDHGQCRKPVVGDPCGDAGIDCAAMRCLSGYCGDNKCWGCCQQCTYEYDSYGALQCSGAIPKERVCPTTEAPIQQRCGGNGLVECDNGYKCVANPNCPKEMTDCAGICVKQIRIPPLIPVQRMICGGFENCAAYNDGCNDCECGANGIDGCTEMACPPPEFKPAAKCIRCKDGYVLNKINECVLDIIKTTPGCGGIPYCQSYKKDSCNSCGCGDPINHPDMAWCTLASCPPLLDEFICTKCMDGYILNEITKQCDHDKTIPEQTCCKIAQRPDFCWEGIQCCPNGEWSCSIGDAKRYTCGDKTLVVGQDKFGAICKDNMENKVSCNNGNNVDICDGENGFECRTDPECFGKKSATVNCANKVCLHVDGKCMFDGNCERDHQCVFINYKNGFCVQYQKEGN